jgi:hypothetical protein
MKSADGPVDRGDEPRDGLADTPADSNGATAGPAAARQRTSWVQRLLDNKTSLQRIVISLGALAAALLAIGGVVTAVVQLVGDDSGGRSLNAAPGETQRIESGTGAANDFVHDLLDHDGGVVALDHQVIAQKGPADVRLQYNCTDAGVCAMTRLQDIVVAAGDMPDGLWFKGCFAVTQDGVGYGAEPLDIELKHQGDQCP